VDLPLFTRNFGKISFRVHSRLSHRIEYLATVLLGLALKCLPRRARGILGAGLGQLAYFIGIRRKITLDNLRQAYPGLPPKALRVTAARVYRHFGRVATGFATVPRMRPGDVGRWIYVEGLETLQQAVREGKGGIVYSGHLGNWEIMGAIMARLGLPVSFVVARQSNRLVEELMDRYRQSAGIEIVKRAQAVRGVLSALQRNRLVAMLIDQDAHEDGAFVPFFGRPAATPRGPAVFHLRTGSPLIFAHCVRITRERYRIRIARTDAAAFKTADELTAHMTAQLEAAIRETPEQWFWMHRRWKTRPPAS
jgi:KDO2-lipid IV(A) lauroyltransferase